MRDNAIDIAKGIGIVLMVVGHSGAPDRLVNFIYTFHMPLFFLVSGYCFKSKYLSEKVTYIKRRITGLYFPYVLYMFLFLCLHNLFYSLHVYVDKYTFFDGCRSMFYTVTTMSGWEQLLGGYWFLQQLFLTSIIGLFLLLLFRKVWYCIVVCFFAAFLLSLKDITLLHCPISSLTFKALFFFFIGVKAREMGNNWGVTRSCVILFLIFVISLWLKTGMLSVAGIRWAIYAVVASLGALSVLQISRVISTFDNKVCQSLILVGKKTLHILTWHLLGLKVVSLFIILSCGLTFDKLSDFPVIFEYSHSGWWVLYSIVGILFSLLMSGVCNSAVTKIQRFVIPTAA